MSWQFQPFLWWFWWCASTLPALSWCGEATMNGCDRCWDLYSVFVTFCYHFHFLVFRLALEKHPGLCSAAWHHGGRTGGLAARHCTALRDDHLSCSARWPGDRTHAAGWWHQNCQADDHQGWVPRGWTRCMVRWLDADILSYPSVQPTSLIWLVAGRREVFSCSETSVDYVVWHSVTFVTTN